MNFVAFPVGATNIFPLANSSKGGQLLTEFNLRSRESVETDSSIKYFIGKSFTHSMDDYAVYCQKDGYDTTISNTTIQIQPGRALVNGHFVELLTPINIDINDANYLANKEGITALKGDLAVGLRMAYSTYQTLAGSALVENEDEYYDGVQVVILPKDAVKLPADVPGETQFSKINMHLLLATFSFRNGVVTSVTQNSAKIRSLDAERIANIEDLLSDTFISKAKLDPNKLYTFAGKSSDGSTIDGRDTWCDSTDSLMLWDKSPKISTVKPSSEAYFTYDTSSGTVVLVVPHKQVDGMVNTSGTSVYYQDKKFKLPAADFESNTGGVVSAAYTKKIKELKDKIDLFYRLPNGRMRNYIAVLQDRDDLPSIPVSTDSKWPYSFSEWETDLSEVQAGLASLQAQVDDLEASLSTTIKSEVETYGSSYLTDTFNDSIKDIKTDLTTLSDQISDLTGRVEDLEKEVESDDDKSDDISKLKTRMSDAESTITTLKANITTLQNNWNSYKNTTTNSINTTVNEKLNSLTSSVNSAIASLSSSLTAAKAELKTYVDNKVKEALDATQVFTTWTWSPGDYVLVGEDYTVGANVDGRYPSTMYIVGPGQVRSAKYVSSITTNISIASGTNSETYQKAYQTMLRKVPTSLAGGVELASYELASSSEASVSLWDVTQYKGAPGIDYFVARLKTTNETTQVETWTCYFYTPDVVDTRYSYLDPIWITGGVPLATETSVGGFINVPEDAYGSGYVRLNESGFLELVDYELLLTGVLAYQLGQDYSEGVGLSIEELQSILEENINDRVCFPNATQKVNAAENDVDPNVIHLYLDLPETEGTLTIHDIGSRYGSSLYVHINGSATSATKIIFQNCDKLRIDSDIEGAPTIYLDRVNLYYDAEVLDRCYSINNLTLWYERYLSTDPDLQVDGMTVTLLGKIESTESIDPWDSTYANDNHYTYSLRSLTFGQDGSIINVGLLVGDSTTSNIDEGKSVFATEFVLPQSVGIGYPSTKMTHRIKITGSFVSHYYVASEGGYMMKHTEFSAITQKYNSVTRKNEVSGTISFYTDAQMVTHINGVTETTTVDGWDLNTPHFFTGGVIE